MSQASVTGSIVAGGGTQASPGQQQARQVVVLGVSPLGIVNTLYQPQNLPAAQAALDTGPLLEEAALLLDVPGQRPPPILVPLPQTTPGAVSGSSGLMVANGANVAAGTVNVTVAPHRPIKVKVTTGGTLGTAKVQVSTDGGLTYGPIQTTAAGWSSTGYLVPGTFTTIKMSAATYLINAFATIGVDGVIVDFVGGGALTFVANPIDTYELLVSVAKGTALGAMTINVSLCNDASNNVGTFFVPASGIVAVTDGRGNGTGLVLTLASTFAVGDSYTGYALPPAPASADVVAAMTAILAAPTRPRVALIHVQALPSSAASAMTLAQAVQTGLDAAFAAGLDWQAVTECPSSVSGDIVMSGGVPIVDTADTDAVNRTARSGITCNRVAVCATTGGVVSPITTIKVRRPFGWAVLQRYVGTDPANSLGRKKDGPLNFALGRDEKLAATQLGDVQFNVPTTYDDEGPSAFLNITSGGFAFKNLTTSALYQDAEALRAINVLSAAIRVFLLNTLGDRPPVNPDGTIAEGPRKDYATIGDAVAKRSLGLLAGGGFGNVQQASAAGCEILATSQLGTSPRRLDAAVEFQGLGMVSAASYIISVQGA